MDKLPTLRMLLGLDKYNLSYSQYCDCVTLYNHGGESAAVNAAIKFDKKNSEQQPLIKK